MSNDSIGKSATIGRIGAFIAALSLSQLQGVVTAICYTLTAYGFNITDEMHDAWVGLLTQILPLYIMFATGRSKLNSEGQK